MCVYISGKHFTFLRAQRPIYDKTVQRSAKNKHKKEKYMKNNEEKKKKSEKCDAN